MTKNNQSREKNLEAALLGLESSLSNQTLGWRPLFGQEEAVRLTFEWWSKYLKGELSPEKLCLEEISRIFKGF